MVFLLRNITNYEIKNQLPPETDKHEVDDLSRIDYYRNKFAHYQKRMSDTEFKLCFKDIMEVFIYCGFHKIKYCASSVFVFDCIYIYIYYFLQLFSTVGFHSCHYKLVKV